MSIDRIFSSKSALALLALCVCAFPQVASSQTRSNNPLRFEIETTDIDCPDCTTVKLSGVLGPDARSALESFLSENQVPAGANLDLNSPGGSLAGGIELGVFIRSYPLRTSIGKSSVDTDHMCASACAFAFFGGVERIIYEHGHLGLHQFYGGATNEYTETVTQFVMADLLRFAEQMGIDSAVIREAAQTPPEEMTWLNRKELTAFGVVTGEGDAQGTTWQLKPWSSGSDQEGAVTPTVIASRVQAGGQVAQFEIGCPMRPFARGERELVDQRIERMLFLSGGLLPDEIDVRLKALVDRRRLSVMQHLDYSSLSSNLRHALSDQIYGRLMPILVSIHGRSASSLHSVCGLDGCAFPAVSSFARGDVPDWESGVPQLRAEDMEVTLFDVSEENDSAYILALPGRGPGWYPFTERSSNNRRLFVTYIDIDDLRMLLDERIPEIEIGLKPKVGRFFDGDKFIDSLSPPISEIAFPDLLKGFDLGVFMEICASKAPSRIQAFPSNRYKFMDDSRDPKWSLPALGN